MNYTSQQLKDIILSMDISSSYANRIHRLQEYLALSGLDAAICMQPQNVVYLSGFNPILFSHPIAVIVPRNDPPILLAHCLRGNHARHESVIKDLQLYGMWGREIPIADDFIPPYRRFLENGDCDAGISVMKGNFFLSAHIERL